MQKLISISIFLSIFAFSCGEGDPVEKCINQCKDICQSDSPSLCEPNMNDYCSSQCDK